MLVSLAAGGGFWRGNQGLFLGAFLGDIKQVMEPILAQWKYLAGSLSDHWVSRLWESYNSREYNFFSKKKIIRYAYSVIDE